MRLRYNPGVTLILPHLPDELDSALKRRAMDEGKTVDQVAADILCAQLIPAILPKQRDLGEFSGSWIDDPDVTSALRDQDTIDPELWT